MKATATRPSGTFEPLIQTKLRVNQPGDAFEQEADTIAERVLTMPGPATTPLHFSRLTAPPVQCKEAGGIGAVPAQTAGYVQGLSGGKPLSYAERSFFEPRMGHDLGRVRLHTDSRAAESARGISALAYTNGSNIVFGAGQYQPETESGKRLLAHELVHTVQQNFSSTECIARSADDWLSSSQNLGSMSLSEILDETVELTQWLQRQTTSSVQTARIEEVVTMLRREAARREAQVNRRQPRGRGRQAPVPEHAQGPLRLPRALAEQTSEVYTDPAQIRAEFDLVTSWLSRNDISASDRRLLTLERQTLLPQLQQDIQRVAVARHGARLQGALSTNGRGEILDLEAVAAKIQDISADRTNPELFYLYDHNEQIAISREQVASLRESISTQLLGAQRTLDSHVGYYWGRYHSQLAINREHPILADITGWLGSVTDPREALFEHYYSVRPKLARLNAAVRAGHFVEAARLLGECERTTQEIRALATAFYDGHIEAAEAALGTLEFTRDAAFAIAGTIAVVVAAPVVAGYVGAGGLGLTGFTGTGATALGTGVVVGGGTALARGGATFVGMGFAGATWAEMTSAAWHEGLIGFRTGFINGAAGGAARTLGPLLGISSPVATRVVSEGIVNGTATMVDALWQGRTLRDAVTAGAISAGLSIPAAILGGSANPMVREMTAPLTAGAAAYVGARANGATPEEAMQAVTMAVVTTIGSNRAMNAGGVGRAEQRDAALVARGQRAAASTRAAARPVVRHIRNTTAAVMIGTANALPRPGYGSSNTTAWPSISAPQTTQEHAALTPTIPGRSVARPDIEPVTPSPATPGPASPATQADQLVQAPAANSPTVFQTEIITPVAQTPSAAAPTQAGQTPVRILNERDPEFGRPLRVGQSITYEDRGGTVGTASRPDTNTTVVSAALQPGTTLPERGEYQRFLRPAPTGMQNLHAIGPISGHESPYGILHGLESVNQQIQRAGIETTIRAIRAQGATDVTFNLRTEVRRFPGTDILESIHYQIEAIRPGQVPVRIVDATISVSDPTLTARPSLQVASDIRPMEEFLRPVGRAPGTQPAPTTQRPRRTSDVAPEQVQRLQTRMQQVRQRLRQMPGREAQFFANELTEQLRRMTPGNTTRDDLANSRDNLESIYQVFPTLR